MLKNTDAVVNAVRYAVRTQGTWLTFVTENEIKRDMIAETAKELAALAYPNDEAVQKRNGVRTRFGNAVQAAANGMRYALESDESEDSEPKPVVLRASLSGEGGGSTVIEPSHPLYAAVVAMIKGESIEQSEQRAA